MTIDRLISNTATKQVWPHTLENELGQLWQGFKHIIKSKDVMEFVHYTKIP